MTIEIDAKVCPWGGHWFYPANQLAKDMISIIGSPGRKTYLRDELATLRDTLGYNVVLHLPEVKI